MNPQQTCIAALLIVFPLLTHANCEGPENLDDDCRGPELATLETVTIFGTAPSARDVAGGASVVSHEDLEAFVTTDVERALRRVPGVSLQIEDGWALRPNISIRGTASERSSRVTLMEDGVLIAPAPYAAPSAYYFPTFGRIHAVEVLKGPASITQGPYTVGGAVNLKSTPVPDEGGGLLRSEAGSDATWRVHGWYGGGGERSRFLLETHQWRSDGYQSIDRSDARTGFDKQDYLAKLSFESDSASPTYQQFAVKLQYSEEDSQQTYLGLTDGDFSDASLRRYGASARDEMRNEHSQVVLSWRLETRGGLGVTLTGYDNDTERAWYKTEGLDPDGSDDPGSFRRTSWANVIGAVNRGDDLGGLTAEDLQAILDGADTAEGSIQLRNNAREYRSKGLQLLVDRTISGRRAVHSVQAGLRYHEDEEDRLQRNDNYQQLGGQLVLNEIGLEGNAGNRVQSAEAWSAYVYDRIEWSDLTLTPGLRYENIELSRIRWSTNSSDPASRDPENFRDARENKLDIWLPGMGALYRLTDAIRLVAGVHRGFATPTNAPGVDPEESTNYELGVRHESNHGDFEAMLFFNDYDNLVGICTNSSGGNCTPGDAFNGNGVRVPGLELSYSAGFATGAGWQVPLQIVYTWMKAEFQSDFDSEFFGPVHKGDPVPYVPENQLWASLGLQGGPWSFFASANYVDAVCTEASCGPFEKTESAVIVDVSAHYRFGSRWELYGVVENVADEIFVAARDPYGARPNKPRSFTAGLRVDF